MMMPSSFRSMPKRRFLKLDSFIFVFLVLLSLFTLGCSESEKQAQTEIQEKTLSPVQESPNNQQASSTLENVETGPGSGTEPTRQEAQDQLDTANEAVGKAQLLIKQAPSGKGSDLAISALHQELNSAQTLLQTGQTHFNDQQFTMAKDKAQEAEKKATTVIQQVKQAIETVKLHSP